MAHILETEQHKRKRDITDDNGSQVHADRIPQPPPPQSGKSFWLLIFTRFFPLFSLSLAPLPLAIVPSSPLIAGEARQKRRPTD